jgi:quinoprotein relay system zinc metallohydrolase 1
MHRCFTIVFVALGFFVSSAFAQAAFDYQLKPRQLAPNVYVIEGSNADFSIANGCNIINTGFIVTNAGVVVINTGPSKRYGDQQRAAISKITSQPIARVIHLNLHPDYFLGNQAFSDVPRFATTKTTQGIKAESSFYEDNLYKVCGDWMKGTQTVLPDQTISPGVFKVGDREFSLSEHSGHTDSDLVLIDKTSGVAFVGGLVFVSRIPTTPHAKLDSWKTALGQIESLPMTWLVPSHGPVASDKAGIEQTRQFVTWLDSAFTRAAETGLDMTEVLQLPMPAQFKSWAAVDTEYIRNVAHLYKAYEQKALGKFK